MRLVLSGSCRATIVRSYTWTGGCMSTCITAAGLDIVHSYTLADDPVSTHITEERTHRDWAAHTLSQCIIHSTSSLPLGTLQAVAELACEWSRSCRSVGRQGGVYCSGETVA